MSLSQPRGARVQGVLLAVVALLLWLFLARIVSGPPNPDSSVFIYVADGLLSGELPYVDRWDHKGPAIYLVDALGRALTPGSQAGINVLELFSFLLCGALVFLTLRPAFGRTAAAVAVIVGAVLVAGFIGRGNLTEEWALLPQFAALFLFARIGVTPGSRGGAVSLLAIGALGAAAFLLRPNLVGLWLAIGAAWLVAGPARLWRISLAVAGGLAVLLVFGLYLLATDTFAPFVDAVWVYNRTYSGDLGPDAWLVRVIEAVVGSPVLMATVAAWVGLLIHLARSRDLSAQALTLMRWAAIAVPIEVVLFALSGRGYVHYYLTLVPVLTVLIGLVYEWTSGEWGQLGREDLSRAGRRVALVSSALGVMWLTLLVAISLQPAFVYALPDEREAHAQAAAYVEAATSPEDPILVWGGDPSLYLLAQRDAPTRFFYTLPLITDGYVDDELVSSFVADLQRDPPAVIIDMADARVPPLDATKRATFEADPLYPVDTQVLEPVYEFVRSGYVRDQVIGPWTMYIRR